MSTTAQVSAHIIKLSAKQDVDPFAVVGLLAVHALVAVDLPKLKFWTHVSATMRATPH
jgi:hypothetical protein